MGQKYTLSPEQDIASNPIENVWVQANAGTGKTSVLVQRLLRILFRSGAGTGILCLTYTNAAAGEMRNRILAMLRQWAMASDDELRDILGGIAMNKTPTTNDLNHAREIFFQYIDNPDMLKIKTIHGFCEEILHRFPVEAGITPAWSLVSDATQKVLLRDAFDKMIKHSGHDEKISAAFAHMINRVSEYYVPDLLKDLSEQYKIFFEVEHIEQYRKYFINTIENFLKLHIGHPYVKNNENLIKIIENATCEQKSRKTPAKYLDEIITKTKQFIDNTINFTEYASAYLTQGLEQKKDISKKDYLQEEQENIYSCMQYELNKQVRDDTVAFFDLSAAFAQHYMALKKNRNVLDFDDLILYTRRLFSKPDTMGWVLSQLDLSLNHILVDEAQDTSPQQWDILKMIAGDFFTDGDTSSDRHSMFVVGDSKQSIYGFQGADPAAFATSRQQIANQIEHNMRTIREIPLAQSFRSAAPILETVDNFFASPEIISLSGFNNTKHKCFRVNAPGLVEIHPVVSKKEDATDSKEYINQIAAKIQNLIENDESAPGDIMVLVQRRKPFAARLVAELKQRDIDVAGSDRIVLPDFPAVRDLLNLLRFCINKEDDYSLCCTLKSPIFRLTEGEIFNLCNARTNAIKTSANQDEPIFVFDILKTTHPDIYRRLEQMIEWSKTDAPYTFFSKVMADNDTRTKMIAALGRQIIDPIEEFLTICLVYERTQPGTLKLFLKWFVTGGSEIKRDMDDSCGVRVVTVHGSKGLEAPIVFLIDTTTVPDADKIIQIPSADKKPGMPPPWIWTPRRVPSAQCAIAAAEDMKGKISEYYRLLYVAMTRARDRLYIYGYTQNKAPNANSWHARLWDVFATPETKEEVRISNV